MQKAEPLLPKSETSSTNKEQLFRFKKKTGYSPDRLYAKKPNSLSA